MLLADWNLFLRKKFLPILTLFSPSKLKPPVQETSPDIQGTITDEQTVQAPRLAEDSAVKADAIKREQAARRAKITHVRLQAIQEYLESINHGN